MRINLPKKVSVEISLVSSIGNGFFSEILAAIALTSGILSPGRADELDGGIVVDGARVAEGLDGGVPVPVPDDEVPAPDGGIVVDDGVPVPDDAPVPDGGVVVDGGVPAPGVFPDGARDAEGLDGGVPAPVAPVPDGGIVVDGGTPDDAPDPDGAPDDGVVVDGGVSGSVSVESDGARVCCVPVISTAGCDFPLTSITCPL